MLLDIQASLRAAAARSRQVTQIGPFLATVNPADPNPWLNYAIPDDGATPTRADVAALTDHYVAHARQPRLEYVSTAAPEVLPALERAGYAVDHRLSLLVVEPTDELHEPPRRAEIEIRPPRAEELRAMRTVQHRGYGETEPPTDAQVDGLRGSIAAGGGAVLALWAGEPGGAGEFTAPIEARSEITSIAVLA